MAENYHWPDVYISELSMELKLHQAFFEYFGVLSSQGTLREYELNPTEYAGLFNDSHWKVREQTEDCLNQHGIDRYHGPQHWGHFNEARRVYDPNYEKPAENTNYEANTEGLNRAPRARLIKKNDNKYTTSSGDRRLPKIKKHLIYTRHPWLTQFREIGSIPMYYFTYKHEIYIPGSHVYTHGFNEPNMWETNNIYDEDHYYICLVPFGGGYGSVFIFTPHDVSDRDLTEEILDDIRECAARNVPKQNFLQNIPRAARGTRRLSLLKSLPKKLPVNIFRSQVAPLVGKEHIGPSERRTRKQRKY